MGERKATGSLSHRRLKIARGGGGGAEGLFTYHPRSRGRADVAGAVISPGSHFIPPTPRVAKRDSVSGDHVKASAPLRKGMTATRSIAKPSPRNGRLEEQKQ